MGYKNLCLLILVLTIVYVQADSTAPQKRSVDVIGEHIEEMMNQFFDCLNNTPIVKIMGLIVNIIIQMIKNMGIDINPIIECKVHLINMIICIFKSLLEIGIKIFLTIVKVIGPKNILKYSSICGMIKELYECLNKVGLDGILGHDIKSIIDSVTDVVDAVGDTADSVASTAGDAIADATDAIKQLI